MKEAGGSMMMMSQYYHLREAAPQDMQPPLCVACSHMSVSDSQEYYY